MDAEGLHIGDGHSDMCPVMIADIVYAKGVLYEFCKEKGINVKYYSSLKDIINYFK